MQLSHGMYPAIFNVLSIMQKNDQSTGIISGIKAMRHKPGDGLISSVSLPPAGGRVLCFGLGQALLVIFTNMK